MHVTLTGEHGTTDGRTRAYVDYRVFEAFRSVVREIRSVTVSLTSTPRTDEIGVTCTVRITFADGRSVVTTGAARWPYAAIDLALENASRLVQGRPA